MYDFLRKNFLFVITEKNRYNLQFFTICGKINSASISSIDLVTIKSKTRGGQMKEQTNFYYLKDFSSSVEMLDALKMQLNCMRKSFQKKWNVDSVETQVVQEGAYGVIYLSAK